MTRALGAILEGRFAGELTRDQRGSLRFRYDDGYRAQPDLTPLSVTMPVAQADHHDRVLAPWLAGLLPDNEAVIARWAREFRTGTSPFALLSTPIGSDCAGAVQLAPLESVANLLERPGAIEWLTEAQVARRLRTLRSDGTTWLGVSGLLGQFSLAGAQAKTASSSMAPGGGCRRDQSPRATSSSRPSPDSITMI